MTVPGEIAFSAIPIAGVFTNDAVRWNIKLSATSYADLNTGNLVTAVDPGLGFTYFSTATLCFK